MIVYSFILTLIVGIFIGANSVVYIADILDKQAARKAVAKIHPSVRVGPNPFIND